MPPRLIPDKRKAVSFKMRADSYDLLLRTARALNVDVSSVINMVLANSIPYLTARLERHEQDLVIFAQTLKQKESA